jgi:hypothetical protein
LATDQIEYINGRVLDTVTTILEASQRPPVILVMSDHGHRHDMMDAKEGLRSLFLSYTPGYPAMFPPDVTPVNVLTRLLNTYHDARLPMAPEGHFFVDRNFLRSLGPLNLETVD